jgi:phosphatidate cytidylyltransferase
MQLDRELGILIGGVLIVLVVATIAGKILKARVRSEGGLATVENINARIAGWWVMCVVFGIALLTAGIGSIVLFGLVSFFALREFVTLTATRRGDHWALFFAFFLVLPLQYWLVADEWYGLFAIFIPVYAFLFVPITVSLAGDTERYLERTATIQWALMICVYLVSHAPAILVMLDIPGYEDQNGKLLLYFVLVVQASDVLQYICGKLFGRRRIAPNISPNKTWEGFVGGVALAVALGTALWWATPFNPWQSALMSLAITIMGFFGGLTMSAIKRDRGVKDYGTMLPGHGGMLDRIDSLCFAAPVFFHLTRYYFG